MNTIMKSSIFKILLSCSLVLGAATMTYASLPVNEAVEADVNAVAIIVSQNSIRIQNAQGQMLEIYKITGVSIEKIKIDSNDKSYELNLQKGCYILKVGKMVRKISIK